uniref:Uncharacterized protein n=1 Tax=Neobodo designis TaxID=312471 RepID=A0A7S1LPB3_NEODS|mmetsp:Transcript_25825/g.79685  ORF Transcript_25825/g.79685 Transcript_25825/m.79685 type:complete len:1231 (+) Transcript_25825:68-3760(+)|eukprot:CAMPEP_0174850930 /NCGR_PEP_ID=MMETSP1114-20130205/21208_1 /TAXON_ID=312471 /ORGANISM="Neobodo designis, Strain CCAP 1951/1" /LENGTH=1230 /DNA_ID=CAMNT_0016085421 /DNA_START=66 /DNA_END=3758 /DNA_ORIENTATION=-
MSADDQDKVLAMESIDAAAAETTPQPTNDDDGIEEIVDPATSNQEAMSPTKDTANAKNEDSDPYGSPRSQTELQNKAKLAVDIIARDHMEIGTHGFAGTMRFVREAKTATGDYVFEPERITVFTGEVICFRWNRPGLRCVEVEREASSEPIVAAGRHSEVQAKKGCGAHHFPCEEAGTYHFAIDEPNSKAVCTVEVRPPDSLLAETACGYLWAIIGILGAIIVCVVVLVLWAQQQSFLTKDVDEESDQGRYKGLESIEDIVTDKALPWFATALLILLVMTVMRIVLCFWRTRITAYGQGFTATSIGFAQGLVVVLTMGLAAAVLALWYYLLSGSKGYSDLFQTLANVVNDTLNEVTSVVTNLEFIIREAPGLLGITVPSSASTLLAEVGTTAVNIRTWSENGDSIVRGVFRAFTILSFLGLQFILYTVSTAFAAARERKPKPLRSSVWSIVVCVAVMCMSVGFISVVHELLQRTYETSVAFEARTLTMVELQARTGVASTSPLVQIFGACTGDGVLTIGFLSTMVTDVMSRWNSAHNGTAAVQFQLPNITFSSVKEFQDYANYVDAQLTTIDNILANDPAAFENVSSTFRAGTAPVLRASIAVGKSLLGLVDCALLRDTLGGLMPSLKSDVIEPIETQLALMYLCLALMVLFLFVGSLAAHIFARPLKFWYEGSTGRWFRFRCSWGAHRRCIRKFGKPAEPPYWVSPPVCTLVSFVTFMQMASNVNAVMVCLQAALLIILHYSYAENALHPYLQAVAFCCATAPVLAVPTEFIDVLPVRITMRVLNLLIMLAATALAVVFAVKAGNDSADCYDEIQAARANSTNSTFYPFTANCTLDRVVRDVEHGTYAATVGIVCVISVVSAIALLVFWRTRAVSSMHDEGDARESDTQMSRSHRKRRTVITAVLLLTVAVSVLVLVLLTVAFNALGKPPREVPSSFQVRPTATGCNGYDGNCNRRVHEVVFPTAHNSFSTLERNFIAPNHYYGMRQQLESGVRGFMIDLWPHDGTTANSTAYVCHKFCKLGARRLVEELEDLVAFMRAHPREVVVLHLEQYILTERVAEAFDAANLTALLWSPPAGVDPTNTPGSFTWPTLQSLVDANTRVLVFTDVAPGHRLNPTPVPSWMAYMWDFWTETHYQAANVGEFGCAYNRGAANSSVAAGKAVVLNHFLTSPLGAPYLASAANMRTVVELHFATCRQAWGRVPNFIALDFWSIGEPLRTVDRIVKSTVLT